MNTQKPSSPTLILTSILLGTLMGTMGNSIFPMTLPFIIDDFNLDLSVAIWSVILYAVIFAVSMPVYGSLGSKIGYRRLYMAGISWYMLASMACFFSPSFSWIIITRLLQAMGVGVVLPTVMGMIANLASPIQGRATGVWAFTNGIGHALGPLLGGIVIYILGWRAALLIPVPICLTSLVLVWSFVPADRKSSSSKFDIPGAFLLTLTSLAWMLAIHLSTRPEISSSFIVLLWISASFSLLLFLFVERRQRNPFVNLSLFQNRVYVATVILIGLHSFALFGLELALPIYFIKISGLDSQVSGTLMLGLTLSMALISPLSGRIVDQAGSRTISLCGLVAILLSNLFLFTFPLISHTALPIWMVVAGMLLVGGGLGLLQSPVTTTALQSVSKAEVGVASGIFHMIRFLSGGFGSLALGLIIERRQTASMDGFASSLAAIAAVALLSLPFIFKIPVKSAHLSHSAGDEG